ncbi:MAG TPA: DUF2752 domain-containing protein [Armatimonadota bacterium]|nr:DUF2752 domain-containing protein [Armatimonadota bacterium]
MSPEAWRRMLPLYLLFVLAFPLGMAWVEARPITGPSLCGFRQLTGLDCPSCGLTRAFRAMGRLQVREAFGYNPLGPAVFLVAVGAWLSAVAMLLARGRLPIPAWWRRWQPRLFWMAVIIYLAVGIGRMVYEIGHPEARPPAGHALLEATPAWVPRRK